MTDPPVYTIVTRVHINRWSEELQQAIPGWELRVRWSRTATMLRIFVPDNAYSAENVDALIRSAGAEDDRIHDLGR